MLQPSLLFLVGLVWAGTGQEPGPARNPQGKRGKLEPLIQLPDDFVQYARVPDGGIRPQLAREKELLDVLYFKAKPADKEGEEKGEPQQPSEGAPGDLFLTRSTDEAKNFSKGVRVNPTPGSITLKDGPPTSAIDVGPDGRAHIAWTSAGETPSLFYACEPTPGASELQVVELGSMPGQSAVTALTVEASGQILLFSIATGPAADDGGESWKAVYVRRSVDGKTFSAPVVIDRDKFDVSDQSGLSAHVDEISGAIYVLYRNRFKAQPDKASTNREVCLLCSEDQGQSFKSSRVENSKLQGDPRSSGDLFQDPDTTLLTWDTRGRVSWCKIRRNLNKVDSLLDIKDEEHAFWRSHPAGATSAIEVIVAWLEQPAKEGKLTDKDAPATIGWQVSYRDGRAPAGRGQAPEAAGKSRPAVFARQERGFTILY
ncbi:MAG: exo-alpha-sialidase [Planctomycetes bacterium]|nr:exo-alpha-sialidase [Planctomycetota bacterium]